MTMLSYLLNFFIPPLQTGLQPRSTFNLVLFQERERILTAMLRVNVAMGVVALAVSLPSLVQNKEWTLIGLYTFYLCLVYVAAVYRQIAYKLRASAVLFILYTLGLSDLVSYGLGEDGRIYLFAFSIMAILLFDIRVGIGALSLSVTTIALVGWQLSTSHLSVLITNRVPVRTLTPDVIAIISADFLGAAGLVMAALYALLRSFDRAWQREQQATSQVQQERDSLEQRVAERTTALTTANQQLQAEIAERQQAEEALKQARDQALAASQLKTELLAKVSHELRTPLGAILGFAEMLEGGVYGSTSSQQQQAAAEIIDSSHYLEKLVNELLNEAQLEAGKLKLNLTEFDVSNLMQDTISKMNVLAQAKDLILTSQISPEVPATLKGDPIRLQQILVNLISNAIKFTSQGTIRVNFYCPDPDHWAMQVSDTGPGISREAQAYIFEPFRQVDGSVTRTIQGTGLGLSIVKQLTTLMGGQIILESEINLGSTFTIILPIYWRN